MVKIIFELADGIGITHQWPLSFNSIHQLGRLLWKKIIGSFGALRTSLSWRLLPNPRWNKAYREAQDNLDILLDFGKKHIQTAKYNYETGKTDTDQISILKKMVRRCDSESSYPLVMALGE